MTIATRPDMQAKRIIAATILTAFALVPSLALAGPEGTYAMTGTNPGDKSPYEGVVVVRKTGETYAVTWRFGADETQGIGVLTPASDRIFAVSYDAGNGHGIALYERQGDGSWYGTWSSAGGKSLGTETWRPQHGGTTTRGGNTGSTPASASTPDGKGGAVRR
ncbi:hypothetical protein [Shinella sp. BYT-45]|uniref:hypothetical protein n=1 Tax=Shinella sp. BYT-45 TaxID=3377377 RepID=UPI00397F4FD8